MSNRPKRPKQASTVILIKEQDEGLLVYLLRRSSGSGFMPGNYVFPGGVVDPHDRATGLWKAHVDVDLVELSRRLGGDMTGEEALAHGVAAIRETFEEAGVFLASRDGQGRGGLSRVLERRTLQGLSDGWMAEMVTAEGWALEFTKLASWSHWITPAIRSQRFDTRFFLAFMPQGQECVPDRRETTHGIWITPHRALTSNLRGEIPLSPPTLVTLHELLQYSGIGNLEKELGSRSWGNPRLPRLVRSSQAALILLPWDPMYDQEFEVDTAALEMTPMPIGEPFSRLWYHEGIWRPIP